MYLSTAATEYKFAGLDPGQCNPFSVAVEEENGTDTYHRTTLRGHRERSGITRRQRQVTKWNQKEPISTYQAVCSAHSHKTVNLAKIEARHAAIYNVQDGQEHSLYELMFEEKIRPRWRNSSFRLYRGTKKAIALAVSKVVTNNMILITTITTTFQID